MQIILQGIPSFARVRWCPKILDTVRNVRSFPLIGRIVPEAGDDRIRERFVHSYRLLYRIEEKRILIVAIIHGKRLFDGIAERFDAGT